ncbi:uncharacterized protein J7T54_001042 [Emericellopsis cladophorae]|uniref:Uncharacterized protein n=1 Tax=Emericellopsis cladophorae TaxID=2686198 RepID=A0A9P9Y0J7_9HYPO|nr:uncharacterized protein J7T54_001042 [Emericellopsis cladophorae]KAI6780734.1 hypothetical protein J7T54_001042 [Emericellopsis cladophorae]
MDSGDCNAAASDIILESSPTFVQVHQSFMYMLTGKAGLFSTIHFIGQAVTPALKDDQGAIDDLGALLVGMAKPVAAELQKELKTIDNVLDAAIKAYSGIQTS